MTEIEHHRQNNQYKDIRKTITAGLTALVIHRDIFKGNIGASLKRHVYNSHVLPAMIYGAETCALTIQAKNANIRSLLGAAHTNMERIMLNILYRVRRKIIWVREKTMVTDVVEQVRRRKWKWAGHVSRIRGSRWIMRITTWKPFDRKNTSKKTSETVDTRTTRLLEG